MTLMDLSGFELQNLVPVNDVVRVRPGFAQQYLVTAGAAIVYAFSVVSPQTGEVFHYIFERVIVDGTAILYVKTESFVTVTTFTFTYLALKPIINYAVQNNQIIINSPNFTNPLYGIVGGGLAQIQSVTSVNDLNTPTLASVPVGLTSTFGDRIPITDGNVCYFNDPGVDIRTYVSLNVVSLPGKIFEIFEGPGGALYFITPNGTYALASDALQYGQEVVGQLAKVSTYSANQYRNVVYSAGHVWALAKDGIEVVTAGQKLKPASFTRKRYYSQYVGPSEGGSYQSGTIWATSTGIAVSLDHKICVVDAADMRPRWYTNDSTSDISIVGMCRSVEGTDLWVFPDRVCELIGNQEFDSGGTVLGIAAGSTTFDPAASPVLRSVTTISDNVGLSQLAYCQGTARTAVTPAPSRASNVVGTGTWSASAHYVGPDMRSRKHNFMSRTDDFALEIGAEGALSLLGLVNIETISKGGARP